MTTPICDFVRRYAAAGGTRLHMPGHKGRDVLGCETLDITEIAGADRLYPAEGIIRESEENAASLFGSARTLYSTEGSSLCIRAMLYLVLLHARQAGRKPVILAARNAHKTLMTAAALLDLDIRWLYAREGDLLTCPIDPGDLDRALAETEPAAFYLTSPDYIGHLQDIAALAAVCHARGVPLLADNAHGAYLRFMEQDLHPMTLGADLCCDSAHKTLPCLTGGAYLHVGRAAPPLFAREAEGALALFASTSPSYLILASLDAVNGLLGGELPGQLRRCAVRTGELKARLAAAGWLMTGEEPMKITLCPKPRGYTGDQVHDVLRARGAECEFSDPDRLVLMPSPFLTEADWQRTEQALLSLEPRSAITAAPPPMPRPQRACTPRQALLSPARRVSVGQAEGHILADACIHCPPAVPIVSAGEMIDEKAVECMRYYGYTSCRVME